MRAHAKMLEFKIGDRVAFQAEGGGPIEGMLTRTTGRRSRSSPTMAASGTFAGSPVQGRTSHSQGPCPFERGLVEVDAGTRVEVDQGGPGMSGERLLGADSSIRGMSVGLGRGVSGAETGSRRPLEAVLHEALPPATGCPPEAVG